MVRTNLQTKIEDSYGRTVRRSMVHDVTTRAVRFSPFINFFGNVQVPYCTGTVCYGTDDSSSKGMGQQTCLEKFPSIGTVRYSTVQYRM